MLPARFLLLVIWCIDEDPFGCRNLNQRKQRRVKARVARVALGNHSVGSKEAGSEKRARVRTVKYPGLSPLHTCSVCFTLVHLFLKTGFVCVHGLREGMAFCSEGIRE